jgi:hypothetical protein
MTRIGKWAFPPDIAVPTTNAVKEKRIVMSAKKTKGPNVLIKKKKESAIPKVIYAQASPKSVGGVSMFESQGQITAQSVENFVSEDDVIDRAVERLQQAGFEVLQVTPLTINIAGSSATYNKRLQYQNLCGREARD